MTLLIKAFTIKAGDTSIPQQAEKTETKVPKLLHLSSYQISSIAVI